MRATLPLPGTGSGGDPGWRPVLTAAVPVIGVAVRRQVTDGLLGMRAGYVVALVNTTLTGIVATGALLAGDNPVPVVSGHLDSPLTVLLLGAAAACLGFVVHSQIRPLHPTTEPDVASQYRTRLRARETTLVSVSLLYVAVILATGGHADFAGPLAMVLAAWIIAAPSATDVRRREAQLADANSLLCLPRALRAAKLG